MITLFYTLYILFINPVPQDAVMCEIQTGQTKNLLFLHILENLSLLCLLLVPLAPEENKYIRFIPFCKWLVLYDNDGDDVTYRSSRNTVCDLKKTEWWRVRIKETRVLKYRPPFTPIFVTILLLWNRKWLFVCVWIDVFMVSPHRFTPCSRIMLADQSSLVEARFLFLNLLSLKCWFLLFFLFYWFTSTCQCAALWPTMLFCK